MSNSSLLSRDNFKNKEITEQKDKWGFDCDLGGKYQPASLKSGYGEFPSISSSKPSSAKSLQKFKRPNNVEEIKTEQGNLSLASVGYLDSQFVLLIKEYFAHNPYKRVKLSKNYARNIKSIDEVFAVLQFGRATGIREGYDGAVALLAECSEKVLSQTIEKIRRELISNPSAIKKYEDDLEILIKAVACSSKVRTNKKLSLIKSLLLKSLNRIIKTTIIDAFIILEGELDSDIIKIYLERFASQQEPDEYVRNCAEEAINDLD